MMLYAGCWMLDAEWLIGVLYGDADAALPDARRQTAAHLLQSPVSSLRSPISSDSLPLLLLCGFSLCRFVHTHPHLLTIPCDDNPMAEKQLSIQGRHAHTSYAASRSILPLVLPLVNIVGLST